MSEKLRNPGNHYNIERPASEEFVVPTAVVENELFIANTYEEHLTQNSLNTQFPYNLEGESLW